MEQLVDPSAYGATVVARFEAPRHAGIPAGASRHGEAVSAARGARVCVHLVLAGNDVAAAGFVARGCPHTIAAADLVCADLAGRRIDALDRYDAGFLEAALPLPAAKLDLKILLEDAVRAAARGPEETD